MKSVNVVQQKEFRFLSRAQYESEIESMISNGKDGEDYDSLVEEYLEFCEARRAS